MTKQLAADRYTVSEIKTFLDTTTLMTAKAKAAAIERADQMAFPRSDSTVHASNLRFIFADKAGEMVSAFQEWHASQRTKA